MKTVGIFLEVLEKSLNFSFEAPRTPKAKEEPEIADKVKDESEVKENKDKDSEMVKVEKEEITENKDKAVKTEKTTEEKKR